MQEAYVNFKLTQKATEPPKAHQVSSFRAGRRSGTPRRSGGGCGQGGGDRKKNLISKAELDACTVDNKDYTTEEYNRLTPIQKQKLWMLCNPDQTPGTGPTRHCRGTSIASASLTGTKRSADASQGGDTANDDVNGAVTAPETATTRLLLVASTPRSRRRLAMTTDPRLARPL